MIVIGCGRRLRRDDQVGLLVAERLAEQLGPLPDDVRIITTEAPCASLFDGLAPATRVILVDAAQACDGFPPGAIETIDYRATPHRIRDRARSDTHSLSVDSALALAMQLDMLPQSVRILAIAGEDFGFGEGTSPRVESAIDECAGRIARLLSSD